MTDDANQGTCHEPTIRPLRVDLDLIRDQWFWERNHAILAALDAGVGRRKIAKHVGLTIQRIDQIAEWARVRIKYNRLSPLQKSALLPRIGPTVAFYRPEFFEHAGYSHDDPK